MDPCSKMMKDINKISLPRDGSLPSGVALEKRDFLILAGVVLLAAVLILLHRVWEPEMGRDSSLYLLMIEQWSCGGFDQVLKVWPNYWIPPLLLYTATVLTHCGLSPETAALTVCMSCGILLPLVSFAIAQEIFKDKRISFAAALLTALNPSVIDMSIQVQRDVPYLFSAGWCIFFIIAAIKRQKWFWWCIAGIVFSAASLIRLETFEFLPLLGVYFVIVLCKKQQKWHQCLRNLAVFGISAVAGFALLLCVTGTFSYMGKGYWQRICEHATIVYNIYAGDQQK